MKTRNDNLQGSLALLVLKSLEQGPMHGWGITLHIERISNEVLRVEEGSLYPALHRMEQERLIASEWGVSENNRRARFYRLTASGRKQLAAEQENWRKITRRGWAVDWILKAGVRTGTLLMPWRSPECAHLFRRARANQEFRRGACYSIWPCARNGILRQGMPVCQKR